MFWYMNLKWTIGKFQRTTNCTSRNPSRLPTRTTTSHRTMTTIKVKTMKTSTKLGAALQMMEEAFEKSGNGDECVMEAVLLAKDKGGADQLLI